MAAGSIVIDLLMNTGSFETDTGRATGALKKLKNGLYEIRTETEAVTVKFDSMFNTWRKVESAQNNVASSMQKSQAAFRSTNQVVQQASYQITDFVVQVSGGVSAMRAFSQQAPQLLGAFGGVGAALGLVAALGGAVADLVIKSMDIKSTADRFKALDEATSTLAGTLNDVSKVDLSGLGRNYREASEDGKKLIDANVTLNMQLLEMSKIDALSVFRQGIKEAIADANAFKLSMIDIVDRLMPAFKQAAAKPGDISGFIKSDVSTFASLKDTTKEVAAEIDRLNKSFGEGKLLPGEYAKGLGKLLEVPANRTKGLVEFVTQQQKYANDIAKATAQQTAYGAAQAGGYKGLEKPEKMSAAERLAKQQAESADKFVDSLSRQTAQLQHNKDMIGLTAQEVELLNAQYKIQADLEKAIQDIERQGTAMKKQDLQKMKDAAAEATAAQTEIILAAQERQRSGIFGLQNAMQSYTNSAMDMSKSISSTFGSAMKGMEEGLVRFVLTGKASFTDFANALISDIMRIYIRMALTGLIQNFAMPAFSTTPGQSSNPEFMGPAKPAGFAEGGYTGDGGKYQPAGIVHAGEFVMSKEATNRIGIGSLNRMLKGYAAGGYVGATPTGTGGGGGVSIVVNNNSSNAQASATTKTDSFGNRQIEIMVADMVNKAISTGKTDGAMRNAYNIRRSGK